MDALTRRLQEAVEDLPGRMPAADQVRHSAEHARRIRRVAAGSAAAGLLALLALGVGVLGGGARPQLAPAGPASRWATSVGSVFTADPVMPKAGWVAIARGKWEAVQHLDAPGAQTLKDDEGIVVTANIPRPLACITDPHALGADEVQGAALLQPGNQIAAVPLSGRLNEYVLWFAEPSDARRAVAELRKEFQDCRTRTDPTYRVDDSYLAYDEALHPPIEEQFTGEINRLPRNGEGDGYRNGLSVARVGSLVVVHEWLEAPPKRPALTLLALTVYAQDRLSPTVAPSR